MPDLSKQSKKTPHSGVWRASLVPAGLTLQSTFGGHLEKSESLKEGARNWAWCSSPSRRIGTFVGDGNGIGLGQFETCHPSETAIGNLVLAATMASAFARVGVGGG